MKVLVFTLAKTLATIRRSMKIDERLSSRSSMGGSHGEVKNRVRRKKSGWAFSL